MAQSKFVILLVALHLFLGIGAFFGGFGMILDPSGKSMGFPQELVDASPFGDLFIPGILLFIVNGLFPLFVLYSLLKRPSIDFLGLINYDKSQDWPWTLSYYVGFTLILWITFQVWFVITVDILHIIYLLYGLMIIFITNLPSIRNEYKI
jgi:hypothetical protein